MAVSSVKKLYQNVIDDVIANVRDVFLDEGVDEQVLIELKQLWEKKLKDTKAVEEDNKDGQQSGLNQSSSNGQSVITQNSNVIQRSNQNSGSANRNSTYMRDAHLSNQNQQQAQFHVQQMTTSQSQPQQGRQMLQQQQMHTQVSQATAVSAPRQLASTSSPLTQQLTLASGPLVQPLFQYADGVDGQKTLTLLPQKVTFAFGNPQVMSSSAAAATLALPAELTASLIQQFTPGNVLNVTQAQTSVVQHTNQTNTVNSGNQVQFQSSNPASVPNQQNAPVNNRAPQANRIVQLDGPNDSSDDDDDDDDFRDNDDDHEENDEEQNEDENEDPGEEEEPLNSEDDVSDEDPIELFDTENVVVCQYDKITRSRNKWKFHLKDGIMNLQNKDYVFQKAIGDAEW